MDETNTSSIRTLANHQAMFSASPTSGSVPALDSAQASFAPDSAANVLCDFRQLMAGMMLSMAMPGINGATNQQPDMHGDLASGLGSSMNMSMLMLPLMMTMMEKLVALEANQGQTAASIAPQLQSSLGLVAHPIPNGMPIDSGRLTQGSHSRHIGLDWGIPVGTPIKTTMDGEVTYAGWNDEGYGYLVIVENGPYKTYYAHLSEIPIRVGDFVRHGQVIGLSGNTGNSTGPHLHYEVRRNGVRLDPTPYLTPLQPQAAGQVLPGFVWNGQPPAGYDGSYHWRNAIMHPPLP